MFCYQVLLTTNLSSNSRKSKGTVLGAHHTQKASLHQLHSDLSGLEERQSQRLYVRKINPDKDDTGSTPLIQNPQITGQWWRTPSIPELGRQREVDLCEFKARLVYTESSRTARGTETLSLKGKKGDGKLLTVSFFYKQGKPNSMEYHEQVCSPFPSLTKLQVLEHSFLYLGR